MRKLPTRPVIVAATGLLAAGLVAAGWEWLDDPADGTRRAIAILAAMALVLAVAMLAGGMKRRRRLQEIARHLRDTAAKGDLQGLHPLEADGSGEGAELTDAYNTLAAKVRCLLDQMERDVEPRAASAMQDDEQLEVSRKAALDMMAEAQQARREADKANQLLAKARIRAGELAGEAEKARRARTELFANVSHGMRTPLTAILGYADLLAAGGLSDSQRAEYAAAIREGGEQLLRMIDGALNASGAETPAAPSPAASGKPSGGIDAAATSPPPEPARSLQPAAAGVLAGVRVLLAEDAKVNQQLIGLVLTRAGAEVVIANDGQAAIDEAARGSFNVVLMDMQMPNVDGREATRRLREAGFARAIVALTANGTGEDRRRCIEAGCTDYLAKPIDRGRLVEIVATYAAAGAGAPGGIQRANGETGPAPLALESEFAGDPDLVELIDEFVGGLGEQVAEMRLALDNGDFDRLTRRAHQMKGAGGSYGYAQLTDAARVVEAAAKAEDVEAARLGVSQFASLAEAAGRGRPAAAGAGGPQA